MSEARKYINLDNNQIPTIIRNYTNSYNLKIYFKGNILNISKPKRMSTKKLMQILSTNKKEILDQFHKINLPENKEIKHWKTGEEIAYKGEKYKIQTENQADNRVTIQIKEKEHIINIKIPENINEIRKKKNNRSKHKTNIQKRNQKINTKASSILEQNNKSTIQ